MSGNDDRDDEGHIAGYLPDDILEFPQDRCRKGWLQKKRLDAACEIMERAGTAITYQHTVLCQTSLPYRNPGDEVRRWKRKQGKVSLLIEAGAAFNKRKNDYEDVGLPYGAKPRLIMAHLNREALLRKSPELEVESSLTAFVRRIQKTDPTGPQIKAFKNQLSRLSTATIRLATSDEFASIQVNSQLISKFEMWDGDDRQRVLWPSVVKLSAEYFESLMAHAVPLDERAIAALANNATALDLYAWMAQRLHRVDHKKPQFITWKAVYDQFGIGYARIRDFRRQFVLSLRQVQAIYPEMKVDADERGLTLKHSKPPVAPLRLSLR